ncbi:hypothetical protein [Paraburkholderia sacchari]|uniref:TubC N-terminal docking domain-related protein n=1 Tax=Paraburkholderia sacchari TaxID=159450 RepID=UPI003D9580E6
MNIVQLLHKVRAAGVTLRLDGETVKVGGPKAAREALRPELVAHKPEIVARLRAAANEQEPPFWPWVPYLSAGDVARLRAELVGMVEALADLEAWPEDHRRDVLARAIRGPQADLLPNLAHFRERHDAARADAQTRTERAARSWRMEGFNDRRTGP